MSKKASDKLTLKHIIGYGCGDAGGVVTMVMVSGFMSRFLQVNLGLDPVILATMLLIWNIWDAVNDPLMGTIMDIFFAKAKPGADKFRPWILASIPIIMFGMTALFFVPSIFGTEGLPMLLGVFLMKIVYEGGYTMMNIGMGSLLGNMAKNDTERATLASARGMGSTIGGMVGAMIIPLVLGKFQFTTVGYGYTAAIASLAAGTFIFFHYFFTEERNKKAPSEVVELTPEEKEAQKVKLQDFVNIITKNRAFLALILHSISVCAVQAIGQGAATYIYLDVVLDREGGMQSLGSALSSGLQIAILLAGPILTRKWELTKIIRTCLLIGAISFVALLAYSLVLPGMFVGTPIIFVLWNALSAAMVVMSVQMQWGLVAEAIDYQEFLTGKRNEGTIYGFFSLSRRVGSTIASSTTVLVIAAIGYSAELSNAMLPQADSTVMWLKIMNFGFPAAAAIISWVCFTFIWNIHGDTKAKLQAWKEGKRAE